jgi:hypothetical protein
MTVGDLIEELKKFPPHYTAVIEFNVEQMGPDVMPGARQESEFIGSVSLGTNNGPCGPWVKITQVDI